MTEQTTIVETKAKRTNSEPTTLAPQSLTPAQMLSVAVQQNADTDKLEKLMELQERWQKNEARKAFIQAMTAFRAKCPTIVQTRQGHNAMYAGLPETVEQILPLLSECQLAATWQITKDDPQWIIVQCRVSHIGGHCEETSLGGPPDSSGNKNLLQARKSTWSYLRRVTLFSLLGLVDRADLDDDGAGGKPTDPPPKPASESAVTDPEKETKRNFVAVCREKTGNPKLPSAIVAKLFAEAQRLSSTLVDRADLAAQDYLDLIRRPDVVLNEDGTISITDPAASEPIDADSLPAWEGPITQEPTPTSEIKMVAKCLKCGHPVTTKPAKGTACLQCASTLGFKPL